MATETIIFIIGIIVFVAVIAWTKFGHEIRLPGNLKLKAPQRRPRFRVIDPALGGLAYEIIGGARGKQSEHTNIYDLNKIGSVKYHNNEIQVLDPFQLLVGPGAPTIYIDRHPQLETDKLRSQIQKLESDRDYWKNRAMEDEADIQNQVEMAVGRAKSLAESQRKKEGER